MFPSCCNLRKVKDSLAAEHPSDDQIHRNALERKHGIERFAVGEISHRLRELDFFEVGQKDVDVAEARGVA